MYLIVPFIVIESGSRKILRGRFLKVGEKAGKITSYYQTETEYFALGYIRSKIGGVGLSVQIGDAQGEVVSLPFVSHEYYEGSK